MMVGWAWLRFGLQVALALLVASSGLAQTPVRPGLAEPYARHTDGARRAGLEPGELRIALRDAGLDHFPEQLTASRADLDAWHEGFAE